MAIGADTRCTNRCAIVLLIFFYLHYVFTCIIEEYQPYKISRLSTTERTIGSQHLIVFS